jgi:hypothetical protein
LSKPGSTSSAATRCTRPSSNTSESDVSTTDEYPDTPEDTGSTREWLQVSIGKVQCLVQIEDAEQRCDDGECLQSVAAAAAQCPHLAIDQLEGSLCTTQHEYADRCQEESKLRQTAAPMVASSPAQANCKPEHSARTRQGEDGVLCHDESVSAPLVAPGFVSARVRQHQELISLSLGAKAQSFAVW